VSHYASETTVSPGRSREEIERTLIRYGADGFLYGHDAGRAIVGFKMQGRHVRFTIPMPDPNSRAFTESPTGRARTAEAAAKAWEQAQRQRWRALSLVIKAKLEAVEAGVSTFEEEFLAHTLLPDGRTVGDFMLPQVEAAYESGKMPALLPGVGR
jgi:hypothetical protein